MIRFSDRSYMRLATVLAWLVTASACNACNQVAPVTPPRVFLDAYGPGNLTEALGYYKSHAGVTFSLSSSVVNGRERLVNCVAGQRCTFEGWKAANGFRGGDDELVAYFFNARELGLGREVHCRQILTFANERTACYVINYGAGFPSPVASGGAVDDALNHRSPLSTFAIEYGPPSRIIGRGAELHHWTTFYVYTQPDGWLTPVGVFDTEGEKAVPQVCEVCHGDGVPSNISPLQPFDLASFGWASADPRGGRAVQEETFRKLNALVKKSSVAPRVPMSELIEGWYRACAGGVDSPGCTQDETFVPPGWRTSPEGPALYNDVVKSACRTCHIAQWGGIEWNTQAQFEAWRSGVGGIPAYVCGPATHMPNAEVTFNRFWNGSGPHQLATALGYPDCPRP
jgi:hypothetical protein